MSYLPKRKFNKAWQCHIKGLSTTIGEVILAMNLLQSVLFALFWKILDPWPEAEVQSFDQQRYLPVDQALGIWNTVSSDAVQRDMLLAAAENLWLATPKHPALARIKWLKLKADSLGRIRNDAAHLVVDLSPDERGLIPAQYAMPESRLKRLQEVKRIEDRFRYVVGDINQLRGYATGIVVQMMHPRAPLPKRPKLRAVPNQK